MSYLEAFTEMSTLMVSRILVIDSDQAILELFQLLLEPEGYEVHPFLLPCTSFPDLEQIVPSLIILGLEFSQHPYSRELFQHVMSHTSALHIPIVICTTDLPEMHTQDVLFRQQGIPLFCKPFDIDELLQAVHHLLPHALEGDVLSQTIEPRRDGTYALSNE